MPTNRYKQVFTYSKPYLNVTFKDTILTTNGMLKKNKSVIPAYEESENFTRNYFSKKENSIFDLSELDKYSDDIGLIVEMDIDYKNATERESIEYYFYNLMQEHFKDKEYSWIPYAE